MENPLRPIKSGDTFYFKKIEFRVTITPADTLILKPVECPKDCEPCKYSDLFPDKFDIEERTCIVTFDYESELLRFLKNMKIEEREI